MRQDEAKKNLDRDKSILLVDVRTAEEYSEIHIPGSMLLTLQSINKEAVNKIPDKSRTIYVYCQSGSRSATAVKIFGLLGYTNVYNIGGLSTWPYETEKGRK
jgi:rhodanese-related sulfurtransferase